MATKKRRCRFFAGTLRLEDGAELLVEVRVTPLDDGGA
jgi:hypothetical protein